MPNWKKVIVSGSDAVLNNITATGNVTVQGDIIAENYIVSSSVTYMTQSFSSGSTIFGDSLNPLDTHQFTGSLFITGITYDDTPVTDGLLAIDNATGKLYYTGSYGNAGGGLSITNDGNDRVLTSNNDGTINAESNVTITSTVFNIGRNLVQSTSTGRAITSEDNSGLNRIQIGDIQNAGNRTLLDVNDNTTERKISLTTYVGNTGTAWTSYFHTGSIFLSGALTVSADNDARHYVSGTLAVTNGVNVDGGNVIVKTGYIQIPEYLYHYQDPDTYLQFPSLNTINLTAGGTNVYSMRSDRTTISVPITASKAISASGHLFASTSNAAGNYNSVLVVDTASGQFYYTGSYGGGSGTPDGTNTQVQFNNSNEFGADTGLTYGANTNTLRVGTSAPQEVGEGWGLQSGSHFLEDNIELVTNARVVKWNPSVQQSENYVLVGFGQGGSIVTDPATGGSYNPGDIGDWLGAADGNSQSPILSGLSGQGNFNNVAGEVVNGSLRIGGIYANYRTSVGWSIYANQFTQVPGSPGIAIRNGGIELFSSESYVGDPEGSGSLAAPRASASAVFTLANDSSSLLLQVGKEDLRDVMFISHSGGRPFIGVGTQDPKATFDIKDIEDSSIGTRFLLKSSRTTTGAQVGDSAGSINFAIDSASFNDIFTSGSVAAIDSRVKSIDDTDDGVPNVAGNIIIKSSPEWVETLNEVAEIGYFHFDNLNPAENSEPGMVVNGQLTVGSGSLWQSQGGDVAFNVYNRDSITDYNNHLKFRIKGSNAYLYSGSLYVANSITASGLKYPSTDGTLGQVLTTDGSGNLTFTNTITSITASAISSSYIDLDPIELGNEPAHKEGRIFYSAENGALSVYNSEADITLQVGQEFWKKAKNGLPSTTILNGTPVKLSGSNGSNPLIYPAVAEDYTVGDHYFENHVIGIATHDISGNAIGFITEKGLVNDVDTSMFASGDTLYLQTSSAGLRNTPPPFPYDIVQVGTVVKSHATEGIIEVSPREPIHFGIISGLSGSASTPGDLWVYQSNTAWSPSRTLSGSYTINNGDLTVDGNIIANQYIVSSSVTYMTQSFSSGSTIFGDTLDDTHEFTGSLNVTGSVDIVGNTQIGGNLVISGSNSEIILISESAQNSNCRIYNSGDSLILYANVGSGKSVQIGSNLNILATSNTSEINGFFKFDTPPNDAREQVRIQRRTGATNPGLLVTGSVLIPTAPDIKTTNHIEVGTHITASGNISASGTGQFGDDITITSGSYNVETYNEGLRFYNGSNYTANKIQLTSVQNMQFTAGGSFQFNPDGGQLQLLQGKQLQFNNSVNDGKIRMHNGASSGLARLDFEDDSNNELMSISSSGNVGIGTESPATKLHVSGGAAWFTGDSSPVGDESIVMQLGQKDGEADNPLVKVYTDDVGEDTLEFHTGRFLSTTKFTHTSASTSDRINSVDIKGDYLNGGSIQLYRAGGTTGVGTLISSDQDSYFNGGGKVGIGTTSPTKLFTVNGESLFTGEVFFSAGFDMQGGTGARFRDDLPLHFGTNRIFELIYDSTTDKLEINSGSTAIVSLDGDGNLTGSGNIKAEGEVIADSTFRASGGVLRFRQSTNSWDGMAMSTGGKLELASGGTNDRGEIYLHADHGASPRAGVVTFENENQGTSYLFTDTNKRLKFHTSDPGEDDSVGNKVLYDNFPDNISLAGDITASGNISASGDVIGATGSFDVIFGGTF